MSCSGCRHCCVAHTKCCGHQVRPKAVTKRPLPIESHSQRKTPTSNSVTPLAGKSFVLFFFQFTSQTHRSTFQSPSIFYNRLRLCVEIHHFTCRQHLSLSLSLFFSLLFPARNNTNPRHEPKRDEMKDSIYEMFTSFHENHCIIFLHK